MYSNDGLSRNYGTAAEPNYPEAAYGFMRFRADVGRTEPRRARPPEPAAAGAGDQEQAPPARRGAAARRAPFAKGKPAPAGARNRSARPWEK